MTDDCSMALFLDSESVESALEKLLPLCSVDVVCAIRCLDSSTDTDLIVRAIRSLGTSCLTVAPVVCLDKESAKKVLRAGLFNGFDEIWLACQASHFELLAEVPALTSDAMAFSMSVPRELLELLERPAQLTVLGDGCGLNFASNVHEFTGEIRRLQ